MVAYCIGAGLAIEMSPVRPPVAVCVCVFTEPPEAKHCLQFYTYFPNFMHFGRAPHKRRSPFESKSATGDRIWKFRWPSIDLGDKIRLNLVGFFSKLCRRCWADRVTFTGDRPILYNSVIWVSWQCWICQRG